MTVRCGAASYQRPASPTSTLREPDRRAESRIAGPPSTTSYMSLSGQTGNVTPVSSSETVHRRRAMAVSWDCLLERASSG